MIRFSSILDGIHYMVLCPVCHKGLKFDTRGFYVEDKYEYSDSTNTNLVFDLNGHDTLTIEVYTGKVHIKYEDHCNYTVGCTGQTMSRTTANYYPSYNGTMFLRLGVDCNACAQYGYVLAIDVDLNNECVNRVLLNSEHVSIQELDELHEVKNIYMTGETVYTIVKNRKGYDHANKMISLPLIPMNLKDPQATVSRVKGLIVFS